jgi:hypothetical protein
MAENTTITCKEVIETEKNELRERRAKLGIDHSDADGENWFGIALSGGGIRSATINLGFLKTLHKFGILEKADYLSTVSGGGYCGAFVQATTRAEGTMANLFSDVKIDALRNHGEYMIPGRGWPKRWNQLLLVIAYLVSTIMSFVSPAIVFGVCFFLYRAINGLLPELGIGGFVIPENLSKTIEYLVWGIVAAHLFFNVFRNFDLEISKKFNQIETTVASLSVVFLLVWGFSEIRIGGGHVTIETAIYYLLAAIGLIILGFFTNPNAISFHRFYRHQLANCYLQFAGKWKNTLLKDLFSTKTDDKTAFLAPYPLINTCLNLQNPSGDDKFKGAKASDYFLLSPLFIGSKLTGYVKTARYEDYEDMTLPAASAISAAAVNPGMGIYSNKMLSILMTLFNARLGFWISNPLIANKLRSIVWWPSYFFKELTSTIGTSNKKVNISDGGHIENLAVYELLRRRCSLIIAFDAGEDAGYQFLDLENLVVRARNELGIEIRFRPDQQPENIIRPTPSHGYSRQRFAVADLTLLWEDTKIFDEAGKGFTKSTAIPGGRKIGTFVYVKSAVTAPQMKPSLTEEKDKLKFDTYKYKIYHPAFPHESTGDQFFDPVQWESYFQLGQHIGADVLGLRQGPDDYSYETAFKINFAGLKAHFDQNLPLFEENIAEQAANVAMIREENEDESFNVGGVNIVMPTTETMSPPASREVAPPPPVEAETGYRM